MISLQEVSRKYDDHLAVDRVSLRIRAGEKHVLIGTSGSGKTTLLKMINKIVPKTSGRIIVNERDTDHWDDVKLRRRLGYVIQEVGLFPHYTVAQNIGVVPGILKWPEQRVNERVLEVMRMVGLPDRYLEMYPSSLSGGQQQRVGIGRALAADPDILLMDEPFGALDPITRASLQNEFSTLPGIEAKTVVLVTHDMLEAALLGDVITVLDQGKVRQSGTLTELLFRPANDFVKGFLENQRDQLELHAIPVSNIIPFLTQSPEARASNPVIASSTSLKRLPVTGRFSIEEGGRACITTREEIYTLFYAHREQIIKEYAQP